MKEKKDNYKYPYDDIKKLVGYSFDTDYKTCDIMPIEELVGYLKDGWVIYYECEKTSEDMKLLTLVNLKH